MLIIHGRRISTGPNAGEYKPVFSGRRCFAVRTLSSANGVEMWSKGLNTISPTLKTLRLRWIYRQVLVGRCRFVLSQIGIDGHPASVRSGRSAFHDGRAAGDLSYELGECHPGGKGRERGNCPFQHFRRARVRTDCVVADVAGGFYDVLANPVGRFFNGELLVSCSVYFGKLLEVGNQAANLRLA